MKIPSDLIEKNENIQNDSMINNHSNDHITKEDSNDFKLRLEKILESPIRKPNQRNTINIMQMGIENDSESSYSISSEPNPMKPVPAPRKTVKFGDLN